MKGEDTIPSQHIVFEDRLSRSDNHKFIPLNFKVPAHIQKIKFRLTYNPLFMQDKHRGRQLITDKLKKYFNQYVADLDRELIETFKNNQERLIEELLPLKNHLNFSLYNPCGRFRGRWDSPQHYDKKISMSTKAGETAHGFIPGPFREGDWTLELETHGLISKTINYRLEIWLEPEVEFKGKWYRGELHLHSHHSDGKASLGQLVAVARQQGLDFFALTDHNTISGWPAAAREDLLIIPGVELSTFYGHCVALGVKNYIDWRTHGPGEDISPKIEEVHRQGGLFSVAHPFQMGAPVCMGCQWEYDGFSEYNLDLMEVWSGIWNREKNLIKNRLALNSWHQLLGQSREITAVGANDLHDPEVYRKNDDYPLTYIMATDLTEEALVDGLQQGRVFVSSGPEVEYRVKTGDLKDAGQIGDKLEIEQEYLLVLNIREISQQVQVELYNKQGLVYSRPVKAGEKQRVSYSIAPTTDNFYYWMIVAGDELLLLTNPVYFQKEENNE